MSEQSIDASAHIVGAHPPTYATLDDWIAREAIPFSVESPAIFNAGVAKVIASLGDSVELLGFGEALHGGEDILILRKRLFQCLVEAHGYSAITIESSFPRARVVNEYVAGRGPASYEAVQDTGFSHGFGHFFANRELVEWMRRYNADPTHRPRYAVIASAVGESLANGIGQPEAGTLENRLTAVPGPARFIPTHKGQGLPAAEIAALPTRSGSMKNPTYFALTSQSFTDFDWLAVLDSTAYNRGGPLQQGDANPKQ